MSAKHTKGPWYAVGWQVEAGNDDVPDICNCNPAVFGQIDTRSDAEICANARRIVACVNALANVSTEWLEENKSIVVLSAPIADRFREIERQRDELLAALQYMVREQEREGFGDEMPDINQAREAIAKATGGKL